MSESSAVTTLPRRLPLRRLPLPRSEPPYDDELPPWPGARHPGAPGQADRSDPAVVQGTLALDFTLPSGLSTLPATPRLHLVPALPAETQSERDLADARRWAGRLVQAVVEVLAGDRPVAQLVRWTEERVFADLAGRASAAAVTRPPGLTGSARAVVRSVRVCVPAPGVAEVSACVRRGKRTTAVAVRLEGGEGHWRATELELGPH